MDIDHLYQTIDKHTTSLDTIRYGELFPNKSSTKMSDLWLNPYLASLQKV